jgi:hypothetical protein
MIGHRLRWILGAGFWVLAGCETCVNHVVSEAHSPGGQWKVITFERDCGTTTGFSTQISVLDSVGALGGGDGNVFIADDNHGAVKLSADHTIPLRVLWKTDTQFAIQYPEGARIFRQQRTYGPVSVSFAEIAPSN